MDNDLHYPSERGQRPVTPRLFWGVIAAMAAGLGLLLLTGSTDRDLSRLRAELAKLTAHVDSLSKSNQELKTANEVLIRRISALDFSSLEEWRTTGSINASRILVQAAEGAVPSVSIQPDGITMLGAPVSRETSPTTAISAGTASFSQGKTSIYLGPTGDKLYGDTEMVVRIDATGAPTNFSAELMAGGGQAWAVTGERPKGTNAFDRRSGVQILNSNAAIVAWEREKNFQTEVLAGSLSLVRGQRRLVSLGLAERGGRALFYDEAGKEPKIAIALNDEGEPGVVVRGASKFGLLYPNLEKTAK